jgi:CheY-like chemotaxis protein
MKHTVVSQSLVLELDAVSQERSLRILLAENNRQLRRLLALILRRDGHYVVEATDGSELLSLVASAIVEGGQHFDLIISQHGLPGALGLSVLAGIRKNDRSMPFILITNNADVEYEARRLGAVVLGSSFNVEAIRAAVLQTQEPAGPALSLVSRSATRRAAR